MADESTKTEEYDFFSPDDDPTIPGSQDGSVERRAISGIASTLIAIGRTLRESSVTFDELPLSERGYYAARISVELKNTIRDIEDLRKFLSNDALTLIQKHPKEGRP